MKDKQSLCSIRRLKLINNATKAELIFKDRLDKAGIKYIFQKGFIAGNNFCIADFYLPKPYKTVIEIDGPYHNLINQIRRDANKDLYYIGRGFKVIHINNKDVTTFDLNKYHTAVGYTTEATSDVGQ